MLKVGITGGIGSGKSLVCNIFNVLGTPVFNSDTVAKTIVNSNEDVRKQLIKNFGAAIYQTDYTINRSLLAKLIFNDAKALETVNSIVHPAVRRAFLNWTVQNSEKKIVIKEAAILFESGAYKDLDKIITVVAPEDIRIERIMKRDNATLETIKSRMNNQLSDEEKVKLSNFVIHNDNKMMLLPQILTVLQKLENS